MTIWDRGRYELVKVVDWDEAIARGEVKVQLFGRRLRGEWHLVRTQQSKNSWLLFKSRDLYAGHDRDSALGIELDDAPEAPPPTAPGTMRWSGERAAFSDPGWGVLRESAEGRRAGRREGGTGRVRGVRVPGAVRSALAPMRCKRAAIGAVLGGLDGQGWRSREALEAAVA